MPEMMMAAAGAACRRALAMSLFTSSRVAPGLAKMQICTHTVAGRPNMFACWSNFCQAAEFGSVHDCTTRPPVPYGPHMRVPPTARYPCAVFSAIEQPMKPIVFAPLVGVRVGVAVGPVGVRVGVAVAGGVPPASKWLQAKLPWYLTYQKPLIAGG